MKKNSKQELRALTLQVGVCAYAGGTTKKPALPSQPSGIYKGGLPSQPLSARVEVTQLHVLLFPVDRDVESLFQTTQVVH